MLIYLIWRYAMPRDKFMRIFSNKMEETATVMYWKKAYIGYFFFRIGRPFLLLFTCVNFDIRRGA